jgi:protein ImuA
MRVVDEAGRSGAPAVVVGEFRRGAGRLDLKTTRRFNLAGARTGTMTMLLTPQPAGTSAALTRWRVGAAASRGPARDLLGPPTLAVELTRNRHGRLGQWNVEWNPDERVFRLAEGGVPVARAPVDRSVGAGGWEHADHPDRRRRQVG